jgi:hypothetical protein
VHAEVLVETPLTHHLAGAGSSTKVAIPPEIGDISSISCAAILISGSSLVENDTLTLQSFDTSSCHRSLNTVYYRVRHPKSGGKSPHTDNGQKPVRNQHFQRLI